MITVQLFKSDYKEYTDEQKPAPHNNQYIIKPNCQNTINRI
jgi:two-component SAPR family response regulator